jgi:hypothetical protein
LIAPVLPCAIFQRERAEIFAATSLCASHVNGAQFTSNVNMNGIERA